MRNRLITLGTLKDAGYSQYKTPTVSVEFYVTSFQNRILDDDGQTLYFINYDVFQIPAKWNHPSKLPYMIEVKVQFESRHGLQTSINVSFNPQGMTFAQVEEMVRRLWDVEGLPY